tara:strand:- start:70 stop:411 length:342 start_codon:yes stop_codon:yes gene_type:complete
MPLDRSKWYLMDEDLFLSIWKLALAGDKDFEWFLTEIKKKFDPKQKKGVKKMDRDKLSSRCYTLNGKLKKRHGKRLPIPKKSTSRRGTDYTAEDGPLARAGLLGFLVDVEDDE